MPADYLSWLPSLPVTAVETQNCVAAFNPFMPDLQLLQHQDQDLQAIFQFLKTNQWHSSLTKQKIWVLATLAPKIFIDKNKLAWIRLEDHKYPRAALWLPVQKGGYVWNTWHHFCRPQCCSEILFETNNLIFLAKHLLPYPKSHSNMPALPTT